MLSLLEIINDYPKIKESDNYLFIVFINLYELKKN
jgi:hypothetical protein